MKKWCLALMLMCAVPSFAHEVEKDGNVGALIHIEPDDAPVLGPNVTWFEVNQKGGVPVTLQNCLCTLRVYPGAYRVGLKAQSTPKLTQDGKRLKATVTFPTDQAYTLVLTGSPRNGATFNKFTLQWVIRPVAQGQNPQDHNH